MYQKLCARQAVAKRPLMRLVFVVAMADSIHTARWLAQFADQDLSIVLFPSSPHRRVHPVIKELARNDSNKLHLRIAPWMRQLALPLWLVDRCTPLQTRSRILKHLIEKYKPAVLHGMETQNAGYLIAETMPHLLFVPKVYLSIWGSDLFWFQQFQNHRAKIRSILSSTDALGTECQRDVELARSFGFKGRLLPTVPASGGIDLDNVVKFTNLVPPSRRTKIMVKGYSGFVGRSLTALEALEQIDTELTAFEVHVYSASVRTRWRARRIQKRSQLRIVLHKKHALSHEKVISMLGDSRLSISISLSDGFPGSLREAMITGCFPIESKFSCGSEWAATGKSALFVDPRNVSEIVSAIRLALTDDVLVDNAVKTNFRLAIDGFSRSAVSRKIGNYYLELDASV